MSKDDKEIAEERDINDVFEGLLLSEEKVIEDSYQEGFKIGAAKGNSEAYHLGYHRGAELGSELGYYTGVVESYLQYYKDKGEEDKIVKSLNKLKQMLDAFPRHNAEDVDILEEANNIRAKFKKVCAQMKVDAAYPEIDNLSF